MSRLRRLLAWTTAAAAAVSLGVLPASGDSGDPHWQVYPGAVRRGGFAELTGLSFEIGATYDLAATTGTVTDDDGQPVQSATASNGYLEVRLAVDTTVPLSVTSSTITATSRTDGSTVTATIPIVAPSVSTEDSAVCPGGRAALYGAGLTDGTYEVASAALQPHTATVRARQGTFTLTSTFDRALAGTATVTLTAANGTEFSYPLTRSGPQVYDQGGGLVTPWARDNEITCLQPGETVTVTRPDRVTLAPASVRADEHGTAHVFVSRLPSTAPRSAPGVTFRGTSSGQTGTTAPSTMWGTTLTVGHTLSRRNYGLASPDGRWGAVLFLCDVAVSSMRRDGSTITTDWAARDRELHRNDCSLSVQSNGNLVLRDHGGASLWSSRTVGTGSHNRLVMRNDGNLVLYTSANRAVWSSRTGIIRTASTMGNGQVLHRGQRLVNGATALGLRTDGTLVVARHHRILWSSHTAGKGGRYVRLERNGVLTLRTSKGRVVWATKRVTHFWAQLTVRASGDVAIVSRTGQRLWHTATG